MSIETTERPEVPAGLLALQEEVPANLIGKLPKVTCANCRKKENRGQCGDHKKQTCQVCKGWLTPAHTHLDYVGHAETTSKLLEVDALWNWEPLAFGDDGLPVFDANGGLWIRLTVCGVTRLGYGTADNAGGFKATGDIKKEIIGDAIRNAAMRYGWALNLWAKADIHERTPQEHDQPRAAVREPRPAQPKGQAQRSPQDNTEWEQPAPPRPVSDGQKKALHAMLRAKKGPLTDEQKRQGFSQFAGRQITSTNDLTYEEVRRLLDFLAGQPDFVSEDQRDGQAQAEAQQLAATAEPDVDRLESDLRDGIEAADSPDEVTAVLNRVHSQRGMLGEGRRAALVEAGRRRYEALEFQRQAMAPAGAP